MSTEFAPDTHTEPEFVCACEYDWLRTACAGEHFFCEHEGQRYCVLHYPGKDKADAFNVALQKKLEAQDFNFRGVWFPEAISFRGSQFSADADFSYSTFSADAYFLDNFRVEAKFWHTTFTARTYFHSTIFEANACFNSAIFGAYASFNSASFIRNADFNHATFKADFNFSSATFSADASFYYANFSADANFSYATFRTDANFSYATFSADADFSYVTFSAAADFSYVTFAAYLRFAGDKDHTVFGDRSYLNLQYSRIEKPERVSFHRLTLRPHWFVNVDARKFEFVNVEWTRGRRREINSLRLRVESSPHRLLAIAYRQLAVNAEENHRYSEAAEFRYWSMNMLRLEWLRGGKVLARQWSALMKSTQRLWGSLLRNWDWGMRGRTWRRSWRFLKAYWRSLHILHWLYWAASGYGERVTRAVVALVALWLLFAGAYCVTGFEQKPATSATANTSTSDEVGRPLPLMKALTYSLGVMSLQKPEPRPVTTTAQTLVTLETIFGPVQAALLALAIRRRFMR